MIVFFIIIPERDILKNKDELKKIRKIIREERKIRKIIREENKIKKK